VVSPGPDAGAPPAGGAPDAPAGAAAGGAPVLDALRGALDCGDHHRARAVLAALLSDPALDQALRGEALEIARVLPPDRRILGWAGVTLAALIVLFGYYLLVR
jgi:hypothetical protein